MFTHISILPFLTAAFVATVSAQAFAAIMPYMPSTTMSVNSGYPTNTPSMINDGDTSQMNGFVATDGVTGTIKLTLTRCGRPTHFKIWNNVNYTTNGGKNVEFTFYDKNGVQVGQLTGTVLAQNYNGSGNGNAQTINLGSASLPSNIKTIEMNFTSYYDGRVEVREVQVNGHRGAC